MNNPLATLSGYKSYIAGAAAILTGIATMMSAETAEGFNLGVTQIIGGIGLIFLREGLKDTQKKIEQNTVLTIKKAEEVKDEIATNTSLTVKKAEEVKQEINKNV